MSDQAQQQDRKIYVTLSGLPLSFELKWPFHRSNSGADFWVLHGDIRLENAEGLHAPVAVNLSNTVREVLASLEPKDTEAPVINALRKEVDHRQLEFVKSGKMVPMHFSSRHMISSATSGCLARRATSRWNLVARKVYWQTRLVGGTVWVGDPTEALYVETTPVHVLEIARKLAEQGLMTVEGEQAAANASLMAQAEKFEAEMRAALEELEKKHAFERG